MPPRLDITGKKFHRLTAISPIGRNAKGIILWLFICECGNTIERIVADVKRGNTKSCGCLATDLLTQRQLKLISPGARFGRWAVLGHVGTFRRGISVYKVRCDCGVVRNVRRQSLVDGKSVSCGCYMLDAVRIRTTTHGQSKTKAYKAMHTRGRRAKRKINGGSHAMDETIRLRYETQNNKCYYCLESLDLFETIHEDHKVPISRGGSNDISNIAVTCPPCNLRKHTRTDEEFIIWREQEVK